MLRRLLRSSVLGLAVLGTASLPSTASAQAVFFQSCATPGVCGFVEAMFAGSILSVQVQNADAVVGSALFDVQLIFANALNPASPGAAFTNTATANLEGATTAIGTTPLTAWSFSGVGGSNAIDLASFLNVFIEGSAASPFRALPGDPDAGTWVTGNSGYVTFTADLSSVAGLAGNSISSLGFCTDQGCDQGTALVATPEPATLGLFATGLIGVAGLARRRRKSA